MAATVLVVEDEPNIGELLRTYLRREGHQVVWVRRGEDALVESTASRSAAESAATYR